MIDRRTFLGGCAALGLPLGLGDKRMTCAFEERRGGIDADSLLSIWWCDMDQCWLIEASDGDAVIGDFTSIRDAVKAIESHRRWRG